jgi:hypothetical protein
MIRTPIDDEGVSHISRLTSLEFLQFGGENVTDAGLMQFVALKNLKTLMLSKSPRMTDEGTQLLQKAMPRVMIW